MQQNSNCENLRTLITVLYFVDKMHMKMYSVAVDKNSICGADGVLSIVMPIGWLNPSRMVGMNPRRCLALSIPSYSFPAYPVRDDFNCTELQLSQTDAFPPPIQWNKHVQMIFRELHPLLTVAALLFLCTTFIIQRRWILNLPLRLELHNTN